MLAILAAVLFTVALILDLLDTGADVISALTLGGLLALAAHLASPIPWRRP